MDERNPPKLAATICGSSLSPSDKPEGLEPEGSVLPGLDC
jgi:hypothetical protein